MVETSIVLEMKIFNKKVLNLNLILIKCVNFNELQLELASTSIHTCTVKQLSKNNLNMSCFFLDLKNVIFKLVYFLV